ncbi:putative zinc binding dehydrogenase [Stipitochalara longipes BDJ]|nr:putative zinc binding dehydrogenase [Stipitochalara longipes BDJ]
MSSQVEYIISGKPTIKTTRRVVSIPQPQADEVLIKVIATGSNPKDWKASQRHEEGEGLNQGDDIAGEVVKVGSNVFEFVPGDRVAAFHRLWQPHGSYAQYSIAPATTTFRLPPNISYEGAATIPLAAMTAALALYQSLKLPLPWNPATSEKGILIYGGASAVGAFALQFAKLSGLSPIVAVAGNGIEFVKSLNAATHIIDYRRGKVVEDIQAALNGTTLNCAFDAISYNKSYETIAQTLGVTSGGVEAYVDVVDVPADDRANPDAANWKWPAGITVTCTLVSSAYGAPHGHRTEEQAKTDRDFAYAFYRYISLLLAEGRFKPHPYEVLPNGLDSVAEGIQRLFDRSVSAKKLVYRVLDTPDLK